MCWSPHREHRRAESGDVANVVLAVQCRDPKRSVLHHAPTGSKTGSDQPSCNLFLLLSSYSVERSFVQYLSLRFISRTHALSSLNFLWGPLGANCWLTIYMSSWSGPHPPSRRSRSRSPGRGYGRSYPDQPGYPSDPYRMEYDSYGRDRSYGDWERDRPGYDYGRRGRSRSPYDEGKY